MWNELTRAPVGTVITGDRDFRWYQMAPARFLVAWKAAALVLGQPHLFRCESFEQLKSADDREQLRPDYDAFSRYIAQASLGDRLYAASLYSFFNPLDAGLWLERLGWSCPGVLCLHLSPAQVASLSELMRWHYGW